MPVEQSNDLNDLIRYIRYFYRERWAFVVCISLGMLLSVVLFLVTASSIQKSLVISQYDIDGVTEGTKLLENLNKEPVDHDWLFKLSNEDRKALSVPFGNCLTDPTLRECRQERIGFKEAKIVDKRLQIEWQLYPVGQEDLEKAFLIFNDRIANLVKAVNSSYTEQSKNLDSARDELFNAQVNYTMVVNDLIDALKRRKIEVSADDGILLGQNMLQGIDGSLFLLTRLEKVNGDADQTFRYRLMRAVTELDDMKANVTRVKQLLQKAPRAVILSDLKLAPMLMVSHVSPRVLMPFSIFVVFGAFAGVMLSMLYIAIKASSNLVKSVRRTMTQ